ncbi:MAG: carbon starvation protein A, partial [Lachnospiraceae bacterium]|nr:carbon starvation protein A [Lachnospiraceae bacterium]
MEKIFGIRPAKQTPACLRKDGVDYMPLPTWKVFLIQFLNIAGLGPIFGAIMGVMFGPAAFLWIVLGTIFAGATHDFLAAMISMRSGGASLPESIGRELGYPVKMFVRGWSVLLLILVGAVFVVSPADLLSGMTTLDKTVWIGIIFAYYIAATLLPIDKLIGRIYPIFGASLLFMALGLLVVLLAGGLDIPSGFEDGLQSRNGEMPVFPMMFVSIACGAISGFHATQSPMMARCLSNEKLARPIFYGAMVCEGLVALVWAAAAIAFANGYDGLKEYMATEGNSTSSLVKDISLDWLGTIGGILAVMGVIAAPITTGDTALRSTRLMVADFLHIDQKKFIKRLLVCIPIFALAFAIMLMDFDILWRYFAWCNQTLAVFTLWAVTVYLARHRKAYIVTLLPAMFMTAVSISYLLFAP